MIFIFFITFVSAAQHNITTSTGVTSFSVNQTVQYTYNFTVNNTIIGVSPITQVNLTLPSGFSLTTGTNGTSNSSASIFSYNSTSRVLSWANLSGTGYLVNSSLWTYFWFNATMDIPGAYNFTVTTLNSTNYNISNLSVRVNDTGAPIMDYISPIAYANLSTASVLVNVSVNDTYSSVSKVNFSLYNSTWYLLNQTIVSASGGTTAFANMTFSQNITNGMTYYINITANDSVNNLNSTALTRVFSIDTTAPIVTSLNPIDATSTTLTSHNFTYNVSDSIILDNCSLIINEQIIGTLTSPISQSTTLGFIYPEMVEGIHLWYINCTDNAGNRANSSRKTLTITVPESTIKSSGSGSSSGGSSSLASLDGVGYSKSLYLNGMNSFKVLGATHSLKIANITSNQVKIIVYSNPQEALLSVGQEKMFDFNADNIYDLSVKLISIDTTKSFAPKVNLFIKAINQSVNLPVSDSSVKSVSVIANQEDEVTNDNNIPIFDETENNTNWWLVVLCIIIVLIIVFVLVFNSKKKKRKKRYMEFGF